jgi:hypothetical protein
VYVYIGIDALDGQVIGCLADGTKFNGQGAIIASEGGNTITYEGEFTMGGKTLLDLHDVYRRADR